MALRTTGLIAPTLTKSSSRKQCFFSSVGANASLSFARFGVKLAVSYR